MWLHLQMFFLHYIFKKALLNSYTLHNCFILKPKITLIRFHLLSFYVPFVVICCVTRCHSLLRVVICCHSLSFAVLLSLSLVVLLVVTLFHLLYRSLSFVVTRCHSSSRVVTRCTTCLSFYKRSCSCNLYIIVRNEKFQFI